MVDTSITVNNLAPLIDPRQGVTCVIHETNGMIIAVITGSNLIGLPRWILERPIQYLYADTRGVLHLTLHTLQGTI